MAPFPHGICACPPSTWHDVLSKQVTVGHVLRLWQCEGR